MFSVVTSNNRYSLLVRIHNRPNRQEIALLREQQAELNVSSRKGQLSAEAHMRLHNEVQRQLDEKDQALRMLLGKGGNPRSRKESEWDRLGSDGSLDEVGVLFERFAVGLR